MPGLLAHIGAVTNCFHQSGIVSATPGAPPKVFVNGVQAVLNTTNQLTVAGCLFTVGTKLQPCVIVRLEPATRVLVNGAPALILTPTAMCFSAEQAPQGAPNSSLIQKRVIAT